MAKNGVLAIEKNCKVHLYPQHAYLKYITIYEIFYIQIFLIFYIFLKPMLINICLVELLRQGKAHIFLFFNIENICNFLWIHVNCFDNVIICETCK